MTPKPRPPVESVFELEPLKEKASEPNLSLSATACAAATPKGL